MKNPIFDPQNAIVINSQVFSEQIDYVATKLGPNGYIAQSPKSLIVKAMDSLSDQGKKDGNEVSISSKSNDLNAVGRNPHTDWPNFSATSQLHFMGGVGCDSDG